MHVGENSPAVATFGNPWRQLGFTFGEAGLSLISNGVLFVVVSRMGGLDLLGIYALALAWSMLFQGISSFGIPEFLLRELSAHGRLGVPTAVHALILGLGSAIIAVCLMLVAVRLPDYRPEVVHALSVSCLALIPAFINSACRSVFLALSKMQFTFIALAVEVSIMLTASLYCVLSGYGGAALVACWVSAKLVSSSISLCFLYTNVLRGRLSFSLALLGQTAQTVFTFGVGNMLGILTMRGNTVLVSMGADIVAVGHFAAATKVMEICLIPPTLLLQILMTRIAQDFSTSPNCDPARFVAWYRLLLTVVFFIAVGNWVFGDFILASLFGPAFADARWVLRILMIYLVVESADAVMSVILVSANRQRQDVWRYAFNPVVNLALSLVLQPTLGPIGAAVGRVGGGLASALLRSRLIARVFWPMRWLRLGLRPAILSIALGTTGAVLVSVVHPAVVVLLYGIASLVLLSAASGVSVAHINDMVSVPATGGNRGDGDPNDDAKIRPADDVPDEVIVGSDQAHRDNHDEADPKGAEPRPDNPDQCGDRRSDCSVAGGKRSPTDAALHWEETICAVTNPRRVVSKPAVRPGPAKNDLGLARHIHCDDEGEAKQEDDYAAPARAPAGQCGEHGDDKGERRKLSKQFGRHRQQSERPDR